VIYEYGSLGASGDLAPLAHLALVLIGEGEVWEDDSIKSAEQWYKKEGLEAIQLKSKEGISLLNGTQFMSAFGLWNVYMLDKILGIANHCAAISLEAFSGSIDPFRQELHELRNSEGQIAVAKHICEILAGSKQLAKKKSYVQDPYSFRCVPQVHGASWTALQHVKSIVENEINAVTDNPTLLFKENVVVSGGNFHGQPLALAYEYACMATAELGSISERRIYKLLSGERGLPAFLVDEPGINSGFMIPQYTAASLVNRNKQLCAPNVTDTIDSSNGQEDHVSMGANVASKWKQIVDNVIQILAIEMLTANQALEFTDSELSSDKVHLLHVQYRKEIPFIKQDQILHHYIKKSLKFIHEHFDLYI
ncbi:MAG: HAL/PAL/TAL family ammonia-lyase, partial [Luteibaculum sp.]